MGNGCTMLANYISTAPVSKDAVLVRYGGTSYTDCDNELGTRMVVDNIVLSLTIACDKYLSIYTSRDKVSNRYCRFLYLVVASTALLETRVHSQPLLLLSVPLR